MSHKAAACRLLDVLTMGLAVDWGGRHWHGSATVVKGRTVLVAFSVAADHGRDPGPEPGKTGFSVVWWVRWVLVGFGVAVGDLAPR